MLVVLYSKVVYDDLPSSNGVYLVNDNDVRIQNVWWPLQQTIAADNIYFPGSFLFGVPNELQIQIQIQIQIRHKEYHHRVHLVDHFALPDVWIHFLSLLKTN